MLVFAESHKSAKKISAQLLSGCAKIVGVEFASDIATNANLAYCVECCSIFGPFTPTICITDKSGDTRYEAWAESFKRLGYRMCLEDEREWDVGFELIADFEPATPMHGPTRINILIPEDFNEYVNDFELELHHVKQKSVYAVTP